MASYTNYAGMLPNYSNGGMVDPYANAVSGGLGTMYGIQGLEQQKKDAEQEAAIQALKFQEMQKDVPLKDIQRQVGMGRGQIDLGDIQSGDAAKASKAALSSIVSKADLDSTHADLQRKISAATELSAISDYLRQYPGQLGANEEYLKKRFATLGVKFPGLDASTRADTLTLAENMKLMLPVWQQQAAHAAAQIAEWNAVGKEKQEGLIRGQKEVAQIQAASRENIQEMKSQQFRTLEQEERNVITKKEPLDEKDILIVRRKAEADWDANKDKIWVALAQNPDQVQGGKTLAEKFQIAKEDFINKRINDVVQMKSKQSVETQAAKTTPTPPKPANVPEGWVYKKNGPKGEGWYKP